MFGYHTNKRRQESWSGVSWTPWDADSATRRFVHAPTAAASTELWQLIDSPAGKSNWEKSGREQYGTDPLRRT